MYKERKYCKIRQLVNLDGAQRVFLILLCAFFHTHSEENLSSLASRSSRSIDETFVSNDREDEEDWIRGGGGLG
jgi:hypothetical protein